MKKLFFLFLATTFLLGLTQTVKAAQTWDLDSDGELPFYTAADESFDMTVVRDGGKWPLRATLYTGEEGEGCLSVMVRTRNNANLLPTVLEGDIQASSVMLRRKTETARHEYSFYLLTIRPTGENDNAAPMPFRLSLKSDDVTVILLGESRLTPTQYLISDTNYRLQNGYQFEFLEELDAPSTIVCPGGLTLLFPKGDYGEGLVNLKLDTSPRSGLSGSLIASYAFLDTPELGRPVTVKIEAPKGSYLYENRKIGPRKIKGAKYEEGAFTFTTDTLTHYFITRSPLS